MKINKLKKRKVPKYLEGGVTPEDPDKAYQDSLDLYNAVQNYNNKLAEIHKIDDLYERNKLVNDKDFRQHLKKIEDSKMDTERIYSKEKMIVVKPTGGSDNYFYAKFPKPVNPRKEMVKATPISAEIPLSQDDRQIITPNMYKMPDGKTYTEQELIKAYPQMKNTKIKKYNFPKAKYGYATPPKYAKGGFAKGLSDVGRGILDTTLTPFEAIAGDFYDPEYETKFGRNTISKVSAFSDNLAHKALPVAAGIAGQAIGIPAPLTTAAVSGLQAGVGNMVKTPGEKRIENPEMQDVPFTAPAVDNDPNNYFEMGGMTDLNLIEVEGNELETQNGKVLKDFKKQPSHEKGGYTYNAKPDRVIIPSKLRKRYLEGDKITRNTLEANVIADQIQRTKKGIPKPRKAQDGLLTDPDEFPTDFYDPDPLNRYTQASLDVLGDKAANRQMFTNTLGTAGQLAPIAYNLFQGMQKPQTLNQGQYQNPYESEIRSLMKNRKIDSQAIENEIRDNYKLGLRNVASGQRSSGQALSANTALWTARMNALAKAKLAAQEANNSYRGDEATTLANLGANYANRKLGIQDINDRNRAARNNFLGQSASDISEFSQGKERDEMYQSMLSDMFANYKWDAKAKKYVFKPS